MANSKSEPGLAAYAVAKVKKDGSHVITLSTSGIDKQLGGLVRSGPRGHAAAARHAALPPSSVGRSRAHVMAPAPCSRAHCGCLRRLL